MAWTRRSITSTYANSLELGMRLKLADRSVLMRRVEFGHAVFELFRGEFDSAVYNGSAAREI
jgi:hypothetical protein